ncbi:hypothetical protein A2U01_0059407, partial [Trifolium medium]|nr:hypothetical protein [Trifolium medium]
VAAPRTKL